MTGKQGAKVAATPSRLEVLSVIDRLEVGPVRLERDRVACPYRVVREGREEVLELVYRYQEAVFDPAAAECRNLAAMITAQVALNYGLFCRRIVFNDSFDAVDRRFLQGMAENTAREIFVKKFLEPNLFLVGPATRLPAHPREQYLQAKLVFPDVDPETPPSVDAGEFVWASDRSRHAVLSSGGKDSLLSYGLLREMKHEPHSLFVNESGKHWFTALNAFRALEKRDERTARVWTNSDRVFNAMLRFMPFVRPDFQQVRSDEYPVRLWTVAVFLFGVLPLLRKRKIGRLIIGDEHDTSVRASHSGITHYGGLYDQSIYFDQALSRYFRRKKWNVVQFSLLRSLSEMLIEKTLMERYPDLLPLQMSCHAAHIEGDRVRPCGECEKCRRIVGMLVALGGDPAALGYSERQTTRCLEALHRRGVHQEAPGAEHLAFLLHERGHFPSLPDRPSPRPRPEILKLRFHPRRSPFASIPNDLRRPLYSMLLEHAAGAVKRSGRVWIDFDPFSDPEENAPYLLEASTKPAAVKKSGSPSRARTKKTGEQNEGHRLGALTWPEAERRYKEVDVALLPVGAIEQHGPHLPLDTDAYDAEHLCLEVAAACPSPHPIVLPLISYGVSYHHDEFSGTVSVSPETLSQMVYEIGMSVARQGVTKLVIVNGHGGNSPALHFAAQMINRDAHIFTCVDTGESSDTDIEAMCETPNDVHAGEIETSTTLALRPEGVRMDQAKRMVPDFSNRYLDFTSRRSVGWYVHTHKISRSGVLGDPTKASAEKGRKMWEVMVRNLVGLVEGIKGLPLDEIYQRRY